MAIVGWGKPKIFFKDLDAESPQWEEMPTPAEGTTNLETSKGDKKEAKIEGGENEDVKYSKNTYALVFDLRASKGRQRPIADEDGVVAHNYAVVLQPEDENVQGFAIEMSTVSVEDTFTTEEGGVWKYTFDALKPNAGKQVKWGKITVSKDTYGEISKIMIDPEGDEAEFEVAPNETTE